MARISIPILVLISVAALLSTAASLAGGLIMYFEGLKSLRETVVETSTSELVSLRDQLQAPVNSAIQGFEALLYATYSPVLINNSDTSKWVDVIRQHMFSTIRVFPDDLSLLIVGAPRDPYSPSAFYTGVWAEPNTEGKSTYVTASYAEHQNTSFSVSEATATSPPHIHIPVRVRQLSRDDGSVGADTGSFDAGVYLDALGAWDMERDGGWPDATWRTQNDTDSRILADKWMQPTIWITSSGVHAYTAYAALFRPPPPPHPWSAYRMIMCQVELWYAMWQQRVVAFSKGKPDTTVVVYDRKSATVFATSTGVPLVNPWCADTPNTLVSREHCLTQMHNMSLAVQEAYHHMGREAYFDLVTTSLDGDEYYVLSANLLEDVDIMWLRPTSTIKGKVQKALAYLIIFSVLVLTFDVLVSVAEIFFIAMPLKRLEFAIDQIGAMRTEVALEALREYDIRTVAVSEIRSVFSGMLSTTQQLQEYKAFMPQSVLYTSDGQALYVKQKTESGNLARRKRVTAVYCGLRGFLAALHSSSEVLAVHTSYVEEVVQHTRALHGVVDDLSGDRMSLSFNTVNVCNGHEQKGALLAMHVRAMKEAVAGMLDVSVAVCAAPALVGNVGCAALKKYSIFGTVLGDVRRLLAAGKAWSIAALCNDAVAKQAATSVVMRHVAPALVDGRKMLVSEMVEQVELQVEAEWMCQITEDENPHAVNNEIIEHLYRDSIAEAEKLMDDCTCPVARGLHESAVNEGHVPLLEVGYVMPLPRKA